MPRRLRSIRLSEWLSVLWLTPAMDRLFLGSAGDRRRFLDRLVLALEPSHAHHSSRYEAAMRARNKLLADDAPADPSWLAALEEQMAEHGTAIAGARSRTVAELGQRLEDAPEDEFARAAIKLEGWDQADLGSAASGDRGLATRLRPGQPSVLTDRISSSPIAPSRWPPRGPPPANRRRCCSVLSSRMRSWSATVAASRRSCCSTKWLRISIRSGGQRSSPGSKGVARCG